MHVLDRGNNPMRSVTVDIPCDEVIRTGSRVKATPLHPRKTESNEKLVLEFDGAKVELRLEDILIAEWGEAFDVFYDDDGNFLSIGEATPF